MFSEEQHQQHLRVRALELAVQVFEASVIEERSPSIVSQATDFYNFLKGETK